MRKARFSKLIDCRKEKFENKGRFPISSSKSERVFSVSHPKGRPEPREGEGQSP